MSAAENAAVFRRFNEEVWERGNIAIADECLVSDCVSHLPGAPDIVGREGWKQFALVVRTAFPDVQMTIDDIFATDERMAVRYSFRGTQLGEWQGIAPTGKVASVEGSTVLMRMVGGKIAESWTVWDTYTLSQQLGVIPVPA